MSLALVEGGFVLNAVSGLSWPLFQDASCLSVSWELRQTLTVVFDTFSIGHGKRGNWNNLLYVVFCGCLEPHSLKSWLTSLSVSSRLVPF